MPLEILRLLSRDTDPNIRSLVANKRKLDLEVFESLSRDTDPSVRARIACNGKVPVSILKRLIDDPETFVAESAKDAIRKRSTT